MIYIQSQEGLDSFVQNFLQSPVAELALDLECESKAHRYSYHVCLIQLYDGQEIYLIDAMTVPDLSGLRPIFENPEIRKIMYSADFDVRIFEYIMHYRLRGIYDLQIAAKVLGLAEINLAFLYKHYLDHVFVKTTKMQRSNWNLRPLSDRQLAYAAGDVGMLLTLKEHIAEDLKAKDAIDRFEELNKVIEEVSFQKKTRPWLAIKGVKFLSPTQKIILKHLYLTRDQIAKELDYPLYWVMHDADLVELAQNPPKEVYNWQNIAGMAPKARFYGDRFLKAVDKAIHDAATIPSEASGKRKKKWVKPLDGDKTPPI